MLKQAADALSVALNNETPRMRFTVLDKDNQIVFLDPFELITWMKNDEKGDPRRDLVVTEVMVGYVVSTVFLGGPVFGDNELRERMFETAVCTDDDISPVRRYGSYAEAIKGHDEVVEQVRKDLSK